MAEASEVRAHAVSLLDLTRSWSEEDAEPGGSRVTGTPDAEGLVQRRPADAP